MKRYPHLFSPLDLGPLVIKNRIEASATSLQYQEYRGHPRFENIEYYKRKAAGGAGIVTVGEAPVHPSGQSHNSMLRLYDPQIIEPLTVLADAIHQHNAVASIQLSHGGGSCNPANLASGRPIGPSRFFNGDGLTMNQLGEGPDGYWIEEITRAEMEEIVEAFGTCALRCKKAGFDMIQLHSAHGWLLSEFMSPLLNTRTDKYGGSTENRMRFPLMVLECIKDKCGRDFPVEVRISGDEHIPGGYDLSEGLKYAKLLEGKADIINVSYGTMFNKEDHTSASPSFYDPYGVHAYLAEEVKKVVSTPVTAVGSINDPDMMEDLIASGKADLIGLGRALIADPFLPKKLRDGHPERVRTCLRCIQCIGNLWDGNLHIDCAVNPVIGREVYYKDPTPKAEGKKRVLVIGGGPGGMQSAITATERGHSVTLVEKSDALGGQLKYAKDVSFKQDMLRYENYLIQAVKDLHVEVLFNTEATPDFVRAFGADEVICAIGAECLIPPIPGADGENVIPSTSVHSEGVELGRRVVIVGGGLVGCETAIELKMKGWTEVEVLEMAGEHLPGVGGDKRIYTEVAMRNNGVVPKLKMRCVKIDGAGVYAEDPAGTTHFFPADSVIMAVGMRPLKQEREALRAAADHFVPVGDCVKARQIQQAVTEGYMAAMDI